MQCLGPRAEGCWGSEYALCTYYAFLYMYMYIYMYIYVGICIYTAYEYIDVYMHSCMRIHSTHATSKKSGEVGTCGELCILLPALLGWSRELAVSGHNVCLGSAAVRLPMLGVRTAHHRRSVRSLPRVSLTSVLSWLHFAQGYQKLNFYQGNTEPPCVAAFLFILTKRVLDWQMVATSTCARPVFLGLPKPRQLRTLSCLPTTWAN